MTFEEKYDAIHKALQDRNVSKVAAAVQLSKGTVYNIAKRVGPKPRHSSINLLANYLGLEH